MKKIASILLCLCLIGFYNASASDEGRDKPKDPKPKKEKKEKSAIRTGWTFGILPSVAYDAD